MLEDQAFTLQLVPFSEMTVFYVPLGAEFKFFLGRTEDGFNTLWNNPKNSVLDLNPLTAPPYQVADRYMLMTGIAPGQPGMPGAELVGHIGYDIQNVNEDGIDNPLWTPEWVTPIFIAKVGSEVVYVSEEGFNITGPPLNAVHAIPEP